MNNIDIVPLKLEHIDSVLEIDRLSFKTPWSRESLVKEVDGNKFSRYVAAVIYGNVIGYAGMWIIIDEAHITNIAVHPQYRGIGVGNMLMEKLIEICKREGIGDMTLEVRKSNIIAQSLYKKYGFLAEGMRKNYYIDNKEDAIIMWNHKIL
ncbi:ribosomal protein S18-alanine N-acetyltransferase [Clostridium sp. cel8]|jgi:[ribosomal protein S18]-alanine N-acetyltransferase|uniref:ribosomal protein S18-alanine N-acetyltransferase n=1 Tax=Clostridium sp. cel8 TaxID=2663123 RepID=UPI0015F4DE0F|nr:ribosomal protein S18-alanine N-acetyltransferase [Clostridium sp. cel8]MBA5850818.1 ribosomal protein S18-alanine N-acetyltransferase [Clostridium sp. cel8]